MALGDDRRWRLRGEEAGLRRPWGCGRSELGEAGMQAELCWRTHSACSACPGVVVPLGQPVGSVR